MWNEDVWGLVLGSYRAISMFRCFRSKYPVKPVIVTKPRDISAKAELKSDLDLLCRVRGRPRPAVTWKYKGGVLPAGVVVKSELDLTRDKVVIVSKRLTWSANSTIKERRKTGGVYTCSGQIEEEETEVNTKIDVHCKIAWKE